MLLAMDEGIREMFCRMRAAVDADEMDRRIRHPVAIEG